MSYEREPKRLPRLRPALESRRVEPRDDLRMFSYNIMRRAARQVVAEHAYQSVLRDFRENAPRYRRMLKKAGIALRDPFKVPDRPARGPYRSPVARSLAASLDRATARLDTRARPLSTRAGSRRRPPATRSR